MQEKSEHTNVVENNRPIILAHVACSGGSVIFRLLCQEFKLCGLSEVSQFAMIPDRNFTPRDPEYQLFLNLGEDNETFTSVFDQRLSNCYNFALKKQLRLLIREHTHSLLFQDSIKFPSCSWIAEHSKLSQHTGMDFLLTVRDPIDSWLGLQNEFGHRIAYDFNEYCRRYNILLDTFDSLALDNKLLIKYEELISMKELAVRKIQHCFNLTEKESANNTEIVSSGNSGRQSSTLAVRPRRGFSNGLLRQALKSVEYHKLTDRLSYSTLDEGMSRFDVAKTYFSSVNKFLLRKIKATAKAGKAILQKNAVAD